MDSAQYFKIGHIFYLLHIIHNGQSFKFSSVMIISHDSLFSDKDNSSSHGHILLRWCHVCIFRYMTCNDMKRWLVLHVITYRSHNHTWNVCIFVLSCIFSSVRVISKHEQPWQWVNKAPLQSTVSCSLFVYYPYRYELQSEWSQYNLIYRLWKIKDLFVSVQRWETDDWKEKSKSCCFFSRL